MERFESISKGDLKKYDGRKCRFENSFGRIIVGKIGIDGDWVKINGYSIYRSDEDDDTIDNFQYKWIEIDIDEPKKKVEKEEIFVNKFYVGQKAWVYSEGKIEHCKITKIGKGFYELDFADDYIEFKENQLFKTKKQLIKHLLKEEDKRHKEEVEKILFFKK